MARLLVGDELGLVKGVEAASLSDWVSGKVASRWGEPDKRSAIQALCVSSRGGIADTDTSLMAVSKADMSMQGTSLASRDVSLLSCTQEGLVRMHSPKDNTFRSNPASEWDELTSWSLAQSACDCMAMHATAEQIAVGGQGAEMAVYDVVAQKQVFQAKGAKKDFLGLQDKPWVSALAWLPGGDNRKVIVGTGSSKIRLYDLASDMRRPVMETSFKGQTKVTSVVANPAGVVWAANGAGCVQLWDITANRMMDALKGTAGSVRSLSLHPEEPLIASVGLDRWLRIHHTGTKKQLAKIYLKQQLTGVAWCPVAPPQEAPAALEVAGTGTSKPKSATKSKKRKQAA
eukprot:jgi/Tetstr1/421643/TSEL_012583.t1